MLLRKVVLFSLAFYLLDARKAKRKVISSLLTNLLNYYIYYYPQNFRHSWSYSATKIFTLTETKVKPVREYAYSYSLLLQIIDCEHNSANRKEGYAKSHRSSKRSPTKIGFHIN